jgi:hypothetical protein
MSQHFVQMAMSTLHPSMDGETQHQGFKTRTPAKVIK